MPRPQKQRSVFRPPLFPDFKPMAVRAAQLDVQTLALDEFEAIRLADYEGLEHAAAAEQMGISRSTFSRLVERARHQVAQFLVEGRRLHIDGGEVHFQGNMIRCQQCLHLFHVPLETNPAECPDCGSTELVDLADGFGHGPCCRRHQRNNRR